MKTLLTTAAMAALLVSGVALADGPGMNGQGKYGQGMSGSHSDMKSHMQERMHGDEEHAGKGRHEGKPAAESDHPGMGHDGDDDDRGPRHKNKMGHDRS